MAYTERGRRTRYDNISQGSAITSKENTILGNTVSVVEVHGGGYMTSTSHEERFITNLAADGVSTSQSGFQGPENFKDADGTAADPTNENAGSSNAPGFATNP